MLFPVSLSDLATLGAIDLTIRIHPIIIKMLICATAIFLSFYTFCFTAGLTGGLTYILHNLKYVLMNISLPKCLNCYTYKYV
jgi:hypothetical protein